jgi:23S rRNA (cytosine1962-C5)-methyltransferase
MNKPEVKLKKGKEQSLLRGHPWVFSGAIANDTQHTKAGVWVDVLDYKGGFLGSGHFAKGSIAVRIMSHTPIKTVEEFYAEKLQKAINHRLNTGIFSLPKTNLWRLVFGEGDGMPGLIIDQYGDTLVIQTHSEGVHLDLPIIVSALQSLKNVNFTAIYNKSADALQSKTMKAENGYLFGESANNAVKEYGHNFLVDWEGGQKTGFFIDQRENRRLVGQYAKNKKVLNAFCYTGGFSIYALDAGAKEVHSVDISAKAMELTAQNASLSANEKNHHAVTADVFDYLKNMDDDFDMVVLDPPAFAKSKHTTHNAVQGYKRINAMAMKKIKPGGLLFTFSCSQNISAKLFEDTIRAAAIEVGRPCRIIHRLTQPADHPVNIFHPEGEYLKGLALAVD